MSRLPIALLLLGVALAPSAIDPSCGRFADARSDWSWSNPDHVTRTLYTSGPAVFDPGGVAIDLAHGVTPEPALRYGSITSAAPVDLWICAGGATPPDARVVRVPLLLR